MWFDIEKKYSLYTTISFYTCFVSDNFQIQPKTKSKYPFLQTGQTVLSMIYITTIPFRSSYTLTRTTTILMNHYLLTCRSHPHQLLLTSPKLYLEVEGEFLPSQWILLRTRLQRAIMKKESWRNCPAKGSNRSNSILKLKYCNSFRY